MSVQQVRAELERGLDVGRRTGEPVDNAKSAQQTSRHRCRLVGVRSKRLLSRPGLVIVGRPGRPAGKRRNFVRTVLD